MSSQKQSKKYAELVELEKVAAWVEGARSHGEPDETELLEKLKGGLNETEKAAIEANDFETSLALFKAYLLGRRVGAGEAKRERGEVVSA